MTEGATILWAWDDTNKVARKVVCNAAGKLIIDPTEILEDTPTDGETAKAPTSNWAHDEGVTRAADDASEVTARNAAIATHTALPDAHHARLHTMSAALDHTGRAALSQMPDGAANLVLTGQGAGVDPAYAALAAPFTELGDTLLTSPAASVSFNSIAAGYATFLLIWHDVGCSDIANKLMGLTFNDDAAANYDQSRKLFSAATASTLAASNIPLDIIGDSDGVIYQSDGLVWILNQATHQKLVIGTGTNRETAGANIDKVTANHLESKWRNVAAQISKLTLTPSGGNFTAGSRFILLGVKT